MKKAEKTEITKEKILKAAITEFGTYGYDGATVNQLCRHHNISKGLIYHNFDSKGTLYLCCVELAVNAFITHMSAFHFGTDFKLYMQERYNFFKKNPDCGRLIFATVPTSEDKAFTNALREIRNRFDTFNAHLYLCAVDSLKLRNGISREDALQYYGLLQDMLNSYTSISRVSDSCIAVLDNHEKHLEKILDYMLYGIAEEKI
ncbi:MAG: TetR/AcrR family transcriptional regulator [Candidatus Fimenecus sp.]